MKTPTTEEIEQLIESKKQEIADAKDAVKSARRDEHAKEGELSDLENQLEQAKLQDLKTLIENNGKTVDDQISYWQSRQQNQS